MDLPITEKELDYIIQLLEHGDKNLYDKLWIYKFNKLQKDKK